MGVSWNAYEDYSWLIDEYMPRQGEGETKASQLVTAVNKLVYKWYNDGDVFDNTGALQGWANDLSSYANWLYKNVPESKTYLDDIHNCITDDDYEELLWNLTTHLIDEDFLRTLDDAPKVGTIYNCDGPFQFVEYDEDDYWYEDDYWD